MIWALPSENGLQKLLEESAKAMGKRQRELVIPAKLKALVALRLFNANAAERLIENAVSKQKKKDG